MNLFYIPDIIESQPVLNDMETHHCAKVLRKQKGDIINITDGKGNLYDAEILEIHKKNTFLKITDKKTGYGKRDYYLHIAIAPTKNIDRFEFFLEKATEIGVDEITPLICKNSERKIIKPERLNKIIESAMKQSYKAYLPKLNEEIIFGNFVKNAEKEQNKFIAHCNNDENKVYLGKLIKKSLKHTILIGPEGDFTTEETDLSITTGFVPVSLGNSRLRTETAGITVCDIVAVVNEI